jgi:PAS domain S-box-containing protein/diguanylate cyclase (GGDEF)-like protein
VRTTNNNQGLLVKEQNQKNTRRSTSSKDPKKSSGDAINDLNGKKRVNSFDRLFMGSDQSMWIFDLNTYKFLRVNQTAIKKYGYSEQEFLSMTILDIRPPEDVNEVVKSIKSKLDISTDKRRVSKRLWRHKLKNGRIIWVDISNQLLRYNGKQAAVALILDVTEKKVLKEKKQLEKAYFRTLFNSSDDAIVLLGADDLVMDVNKCFERLFGYARIMVLGRRIDDLIVPPHLNHEIQQSWDAIRQHGYVYREAMRLRKDGTPIDVSISGYPIEGPSGMIGVYMIYRDITEKNNLLKQLDFQTTHDGITGLKTRQIFQQDVDHLLSDIRHGDEHAVLNITIDRLTLINQICGYDAGDDLLKHVAKQIAHQPVDGELAHLGGPEFALMLRNITQCEVVRRASAIIENIRAMKFAWEDQLLVIGASIGIVPITRTSGSKTAREILAMAETACRVARDRGGNRSHIVDEDDQESARLRDEAIWISRIHKAIEANRFVLYAQRVVSTQLHKNTKGVELLVRMLDLDGSLISPGAFIPIAERYQLMRQIDRWVVKRALFSLDSPARNHNKKAGLISINLSGETIGDDDACNHILDLLQESPVPPSLLCFEITETAAVQSTINARDFIKRVRGLGAQIALDDFGSGMSSFRYLRELQADYVKIDGIFVRNVMANMSDKVMVEAICRMVHTLKMEVVAEFVETVEMIDCLRGLGVDYVQGYAIHKPELWM